jgi:multidrug transporter EmrE-like cation transporter
VFNSAANLLLKFGMKKTGNFDLSSISGIIHGLILNPMIIGGAASYVISMLFYMFAIKRINLSIGYPISVSLAIITVTILSSLFLKETISLNQIFGSVVILLGIFILTR